MLEKVISLEDIPLVDFLGVQNANIKEISSAFPKSKLISRGNEIRVRGAEPEITRISEILESLVAHFQKHGHITPTQIKSYVQDGPQAQDLDQLDENVILIGNKGLVIKARTPNQIKLLKAAQQHDLVFATGPAGTGKTYTAVAIAVKALRNKEVKKIIITRPAVEAGENLGFLPGDLKEKIDPYLRPIYDALDDMLPTDRLKLYLENRTIEIAPLAYMRGRTLKSAFILLDEAQNTTSMQMKMFLTRMGPNSKVIITGDRTQVDLPKNQKSGLIDALHILAKVKGVGFVELDSMDVVRHKLVKEILAAYDKSET
ncbi:MAG: PhoH family protein [Spirosomataceae bacterium]